MPRFVPKEFVISHSERLGFLLVPFGVEFWAVSPGLWARLSHIIRARLVLRPSRRFDALGHDVKRAITLLPTAHILYQALLCVGPSRCRIEWRCSSGGGGCSWHTRNTCTTDTDYSTDRCHTLSTMDLMSYIGWLDAGFSSVLQA